MKLQTEDMCSTDIHKKMETLSSNAGELNISLNVDELNFSLALQLFDYIPCVTTFSSDPFVLKPLIL